LDTADTGDIEQAEAYCDMVVGGGCLAPTAEGACPEDPEPEGDTGEEEDAGSATLVGGGCQIAPVAAPTWLLLLLLVWCMRASAADVEQFEHLDGGIPGAVAADIGDDWTSRFSLGVSASQNPVALRTHTEIEPLVTDLHTGSVSASVNFKGLIRGGVLVPAHVLRGPVGDSGLGQPTFFGVLPVSEGDFGRTAALFSLEPPLWATPSFVGQVSTTAGVIREVNRGSWLWVASARLRMQAVEQLPGLRWGSRVEGVAGGRYQPASIGGGLTVIASAPAIPIPINLAELPVEVVGFARLSGPRFALLTGAGVGATKGLGAPEARLFATAQMFPPKKPRVEVQPVAIWSIVVESTVELEQVWVSVDGVGDWQLSHRIKRELPPGFHDLQVSAEGHRSYRGRIEVGEGRQRTLVTLEPLSLGVLAVTLLDQTGVPLEGSVRVSGEDHDVPTGGAQVMLDAGSHPLVARAPGFQSLLVSVDIPLDGVSSRTLALRQAPIVVGAEEAEVRETVLFDLDSARISEDGQQWLDRLAAFLLTEDHIELLRVEGHADAIGNSRYNLGLSETRANAVVTGLAARGVASERLEAIGSGESGTANRQVDFHVLVWADETPISVPELGIHSVP